jgi:hypothetical protein
MFDTGVDGPLGEVLASIRSVMAGIEFDSLDAQDAAQLVEECAEAERLLAALRVLAASSLEDKALWRREGFGPWVPGWRQRLGRRRVHPLRRWRWPLSWLTCRW